MNYNINIENQSNNRKYKTNINQNEKDAEDYINTNDGGTKSKKAKDKQGTYKHEIKKTAERLGKLKKEKENLNTSTKINRTGFPVPISKFKYERLLSAKSRYDTEYSAYDKLKRNEMLNMTLNQSMNRTS